MTEASHDRTTSSYPTTHSATLSSEATISVEHLPPASTDAPPHSSSESAEDSSATHRPLPSNSGDLNARTESPAKKTCQSPVCKSLSSRMLSFMNHSADPCENFYEYACGGMRSRNSAWIAEVPRGSDSWSRLSDMTRRVNISSPMSHQKFKSFYESCLYYNQHIEMDQRIEKARKIISNVGRIYNSTDLDGGAENLTHVIGKLLKYHFSPLLDIILDVDSHNSSKFALKLTVPVFMSPFGDSGESESVSLNGWPKQSCVDSATAKPGHGENVDFNSRYQSYSKCAVDYNDYVHLAKEAVAQVHVFQHLNDTQISNLIKDSVIYMDFLLAALTPDIVPKPGDKRQRILAKEYIEYTIKDLMEKFPIIDWKILISMLLEYEVPEDTVVQVYFESYFKALFAELESPRYTTRRIINALMVMFTHELYYGLVIHRESCNREAYCLKVSRKLMDDVSSALFLKSFDSEQLSKFQSLISKTFNELSMSLKSEISKMTWMDADSQRSSLEKVYNMRLFADGGVSVFLNDTHLDSQLHEFAMNSEYMENAILLLQRYRKRMYSAYNKDPSKPEQIWSHFLLPFDDNAKVIYGLNAIAVPYGMLSKPFFSEDYPTYIQMASLGHVLAHEIWHHFDTAGILYDSKGSKKGLLSEQSKSRMDRLAECISKQDSGERVQSDDDGRIYSYELNSGLSLNERLADIGASHLAYLALWGPTAASPLPEEALPWSSMTPQQLFFLSMAQNFCTKLSVYDYIVSIFESEHLPSFRRINDMFSNSQEFIEAFSCSARAACDPFRMNFL